MDYQSFLQAKSQIGHNSGFEPNFLPPFLFDFQRHLVEWAVQKGRAAIFAYPGLGKTPMLLCWATNVVRHTNKPVLVLAPLPVCPQTLREADKFGIQATRSQDGKHRSGIIVSNYERLHLFDPSDFSGVVCDEPILKNFTGTIRKRITRFMSKLPYRLLCTATPSPNDYIELGNCSEALGELSYSEMLRRFFQQLDDKGQKRENRLQEDAEAIIASDPSYFQKLAYRVAQTIGQWRLKHHAIAHFWRWVASWAKLCRKPSDLGSFDDEPYRLPELREHTRIITPKSPPPGMLFNLPAFGMHEERQERRRTLTERTEFVSGLVKHDRPAAIWCHMNDEADRLEEVIPDASQIAGRTPENRKLELYEAFANGSLRVLIIKPKLGAWGLNWQHCNHVVTFVSHSWEQHYQLIHRCWRFGQTMPVDLDIVATEGELRVLGNLKRKADRAEKMFDSVVREANNATRIERGHDYVNSMEVPAWLLQSSNGSV